MRELIKDTCIVLLAAIYPLITVALLFVVYGGDPQGVYWDCKKLETRVDKLETRYMEHSHTGIYGGVAGK